MTQSNALNFKKCLAAVTMVQTTEKSKQKQKNRKQDRNMVYTHYKKILYYLPVLECTVKAFHFS